MSWDTGILSSFPLYTFLKISSCPGRPFVSSSLESSTFLVPGYSKGDNNLQDCKDCHDSYHQVICIVPYIAKNGYKAAISGVERSLSWPKHAGPGLLLTLILSTTYSGTMKAGGTRPSPSWEATTLPSSVGLWRKRRLSRWSKAMDRDTSMWWSRCLYWVFPIVFLGFLKFFCTKYFNIFLFCPNAPPPSVTFPMMIM